MSQEKSNNITDLMIAPMNNEVRPFVGGNALCFDQSLSSSEAAVRALLQAAGLLAENRGSVTDSDLNSSNTFKVSPVPAALKGLSVIMGVSKLRAPLITVRGANVEGVTSAVAYFDPASWFGTLLGEHLSIFRVNQPPFVDTFDATGATPAGAKSISFNPQSVAPSAANGPIGWLITHRTLDTLSGVSPVTVNICSAATAAVLYSYVLRPLRIGTECYYFVFNTAAGNTLNFANSAAANAALGPFPTNSIVTTTSSGTADSTFLNAETQGDNQLVLTGTNAEVSVYPVFANPFTRAAFLAYLREGRMDLFGQWVIQNYQNNSSIKFA